VAQIWASVAINGAFTIVVRNGAAVSHAAGQQACGQQQSSNNFHRSIREFQIRTVRRRLAARQSGIA
jgi:hypothetical protein